MTDTALPSVHMMVIAKRIFGVFLVRFLTTDHFCWSFALLYPQEVPLDVDGMGNGSRCEPGSLQSVPSGSRSVVFSLLCRGLLLLCCGVEVMRPEKDPCCRTGSP